MQVTPDSDRVENAVLKGKDGARIVLCGTGVLNINAAGKNGVKAGASDGELGEASLTVTELTLNVTAPNDGVKAECDLAVTGGTLTVSAGDDAVCSDGTLTVGADGADGPKLEITDCTEGLEATQVRILSGDVDISASDDGINAVAETGTADITVAGGTVRVDAANGDGLDSNGTVNITGGDLRVFSSSRADNSPLDYGTDMSITGGTVLAVGSSGMAQPPSTEGQIYMAFSAGSRVGGPGGSEAGGMDFALTAGDKVQILDESGKVLAEAEALRAADYVFFSCPELTDGQTGTLSVNGTAVGTAAATAEPSAFGGLPDMGGPGGDRPGMPEGGEFGNMPQPPDGEFGNMPQPPDGNFGNMPQPPDGEFGDPPQRPDGEFDPGSMPQPPGERPGMPGQNGAGGQDSAPPDAGEDGGMT